MHLIENIREAAQSIASNKLRTLLTIAIIAIGIMALVGILTAIDGIKSAIGESFSQLGANTFFMADQRAGRVKKGGVIQKSYPPITFHEATRFKKNYYAKALTTLYAPVTWSAKVKYESEVTHPNIRVIGAASNYLYVQGYRLSEGRGVSSFEQQHGTNVVCIGQAVFKELFKDKGSPINKSISFSGSKFKVIGVLAAQGSESGKADRTMIIPLNAARKIAKSRVLRYRIGVAVKDPSQMEYKIGEATGLMKAIRKDRPGSENSFRIEQKESLAERLGEISTYLSLGGFTIGLITLLGASIGLMNIMLVSVTERTREIGVRKAIGATPKNIKQQFLIEALVITQLGGLGGVTLGFLIGNLVSGLLAGAFVFPWVWLVFGLAVSMVVGLLSGYLPARKAARLDPIASLRFE